MTTVDALGIDIDGLLEAVEQCRVTDQWREDDREFALGEVPESLNVAEVILPDALRDRIEAIGEQLRNVEVVRGHFGTTPRITDFSLWWSFGGREEREAQLWHRDIDNIYFLKIFIYLTDVGEADGPHGYVLGSHRWNRHLGFQRFTPAEMDELLPSERQTSCLGAPGSVIVEDTFGFHRGTSPAPSRRRCILQYQFSLFDNP